MTGAYNAAIAANRSSGFQYRNNMPDSAGSSRETTCIQKRTPLFGLLKPIWMIYSLSQFDIDNPTEIHVCGLLLKHRPRSLASIWPQRVENSKPGLSQL